MNDQTMIIMISLLHSFYQIVKNMFMELISLFIIYDLLIQVLIHNLLS